MTASIRASTSHVTELVEKEEDDQCGPFFLNGKSGYKLLVVNKIQRKMTVIQMTMMITIVIS